MRCWLATTLLVTLVASAAQAQDTTDPEDEELEGVSQPRGEDGTELGEDAPRNESEPDADVPSDPATNDDAEPTVEPAPVQPADTQTTEGDDADAEDAGDRAAGDDDADDDADDEEEPRRSHDAELFRYDEGTGEQALAGVLTLIGAATGIAGLAVLIERLSAVDQCLELESRDPPTMGCANVATIRDQRNVGIGILVGGFSVAIGAGIAWAVLAATQPDEGEAALSCVGLACVGRF